MTKCGAPSERNRRYHYALCSGYCVAFLPVLFQGLRKGIDRHNDNNALTMSRGIAYLRCMFNFFFPIAIAVPAYVVLSSEFSGFHRAGNALLFPVHIPDRVNDDDRGAFWVSSVGTLSRTYPFLHKGA